MQLADIQLNTAQVAALIRILNQEVKAEEGRRAEADEELSKSAIYEQRYGKLTGLARDWARKNGNIEGMPAYALAAATWDLFTTGEGWYSEMDVDHYFEGDDDWQEMWETAYIDECNTMKQPAHTRA